MVLSHHLSIKTTSYFKKHNIIDSTYLDEYNYCFEYLYDLLIYNTSLIVLGFICNDVPGSIIYILCMSALKSVAGGFHARNRFTCSILSYSLFFIVILLYKPLYNIAPFMKNNLPLSFELLFFIPAVIIMILSPVENINKHFSITEKKRKKQYTFMLLTLITIVYGGLTFKTINQLCFLITLCLYITVANQTIGILVNKTNTNGDLKKWP